MRTPKKKTAENFIKDIRFYIKATGTNMEMDELWDLIDEMDADDLA